MTERAGVNSAAPAAWYAAWLVAGPFAVLGVWYAYQVGFGYDSHAYWVAVQDMDHLYQTPALTRDAYLYSPLFAQAVWPLGRLPWPIFGLLWSTVQAGLFLWLLHPLALRWRLPALFATIPEILTGNIYAPMAVALVLGVTRGGPWVFLALTKVTPVGIGAVWLITGRRWPALARAGILGSFLVSASYVVAPVAWNDWVQMLVGRGSGGIPAIRFAWLPVTCLVVGLVLSFAAANTGLTWLLPIAMVMVSPTLGPNTATLLTALPRLRAAGSSARELSRAAEPS